MKQQTKIANDDIKAVNMERKQKQKQKQEQEQEQEQEQNKPILQNYHTNDKKMRKASRQYRPIKPKATMPMMTASSVSPTALSSYSVSYSPVSFVLLAQPIRKLVLLQRNPLSGDKITLNALA